MRYHGSWYLTGEKAEAPEHFSWRLNYIPISPSNRTAIRISLDISPPPKWGDRSHDSFRIQSFRLLDDFRRAGHLPWLEEVRVDGPWCKCLLDLGKLSAFIRPLLDKARIMEEDDRLIVSESELQSLQGRVLAYCAPTVGGSGTVGSPMKYTLQILIDVYVEQLHPVLPPQWEKIEKNVRLLVEEHPAKRYRAFVMMRFGSTTVHAELMSAIRETLLECGIVAIRADEREYSDDLMENVLTYLYGCELGVAVFDRIESHEFNPNVTLEVGYMMALSKPVCLLKDVSLVTLTTDLSGKLYRPFNSYEIRQTVPKALMSWLTARRLI